MGARVVYRLLLIGLAACPIAAEAFKNIRTDQVCIAETGLLPLPRPAPIPVGCELIDCCPGCPATGRLDWRINIDTKILDGVELQFEGPAREPGALKVNGNAKVQGDRIFLGRGNSTIRGVPFNAGAISVGLLSPAAGKDAIRRLSKGAGGAVDHVTVEQFIGSIPVNTFRWRLTLSKCAAQSMAPKALRKAVQDKLVVQGIPSGQSVTVMMDARTGTNQCTEDKVWNTSGESLLGNVRSNSSTCKSQIAVFGNSTAVLFDSTTTWTDSPGDIRTMTPLIAPIAVPIHIWVANSDLTCDASSMPAEHLANAAALYTTNKVGVVFQPSCEVVTGDAKAMAAIARGIGTPDSNGAVACDDLGAVQGSGKYTANQLNVYYVKKDFPGRNCAIRTNPADTTPGDGNITYVGAGPVNPPNIATLAHEIGHAFGLRPADGGTSGTTSWQGGGHVNPNGVALPGFDTTNIMWGGGPPTRSRLKVGQVFRMNTHDDQWGGSMLVKNNPALQKLRCDPLWTIGNCPALGVEWP